MYFGHLRKVIGYETKVVINRYHNKEYYHPCT